MSNLENNEKILKIFSNIRCLNRDQLPRYLDGRLTDVEKHLVEQHLVDCDLCFDALQVLQQQQYREKYQPLSASMLQYIRNSIKQVSHAHKAERYQRQEQKKESFLIYFWVVAAIAAGAGLIYLIQQQDKFKAPVTKAMASNTEVPAPAVNAPAVQAAVVTPVRAETADTLRHHPAPPSAATTAPVAPPAATPATAVPKPVVKDSVKAKTPAAVPVNKDSAKKQAPPATKPAEVKETVKTLLRSIKTRLQSPGRRMINQILNRLQKRRKTTMMINLNPNLLQSQRPAAQMNSCIRQPWSIISRETSTRLFPAINTFPAAVVSMANFHVTSWRYVTVAKDKQVRPDVCSRKSYV